MARHSTQRQRQEQGQEQGKSWKSPPCRQRGLHGRVGRRRYGDRTTQPTQTQGLRPTGEVVAEVRHEESVLHAIIIRHLYFVLSGGAWRSAEPCTAVGPPRGRIARLCSVQPPRRGEGETMRAPGSFERNYQNCSAVCEELQSHSQRLPPAGTRSPTPCFLGQHSGTHAGHERSHTLYIELGAAAYDHLLVLTKALPNPIATCERITQILFDFLTFMPCMWRANLVRALWWILVTMYYKQCYAPTHAILRLDLAGR